MQRARNPPDQPRQPENGRTGHGSKPQDEGEDPWDVRIALVFDGGGVRGYFSLLVLEDLMKEIEAQEQRDGNIRHSFDPCVCPPALSDVPTPFLPCHYFDYIGGTSTGGLISIMLSRFRMTSSDCLGEYETMAGKIFGNPRRCYAGRKFSLVANIKRRKYPTRDMRQAIKYVISRRQERAPIHADPDEVLFQTEPGTCRGIVVSAHKETWAYTPVLIRSYGDEGPDKPRSMIQGGTLPVGFAARAATAAPTFFRNLTLDMERPADPPGGRVHYRLADRRGAGRAAPGWERRTFTDAGWVRANNPCHLVLDELDAAAAARPPPRVVLVSVGTADRPGTTGEGGGFAADVRAMVQQATDPEEVHQRMRGRARGAAGRLAYFRFNLPGGLPVATDEWHPRGHGETTRQTIRAAFAAWRAEDQAQRDKIECARRLVQLRRQRVSADRPKWDRYASGYRYPSP